MKKPITKLTTDLNNIQALPDVIIGQSVSLKGTFDESGNEIKAYVNTVLTEELNGSEGANKIGLTNPNLLSDNVAGGIEEVRQVAVQAQAGTILPNSITNEQLSADVKVGSLGTLSTVNKSSVTVAINEVVSSLLDTQVSVNLKAPLNSPNFTGTVSGVTKAMVGLGNVDNTTDLNKPVSSATQNALNLKANLASPTFTGTPAGPTPADNDNTTKLATTAYVMRESAKNIIPSGVIWLWSGTIATIPSGWLLCNGSNGTPDLRDRFVVGAGTTYTPGATGGANTVTLGINEMPSHTHNISITTDPESSHTHTTFSPTGTFLAQTGTGATTLTGSSNVASGAGSAHTHGVSGTTTSRGSGLSHENRPPYYALAYIMKS